MLHALGRPAVAPVQSLLRGCLQEGSCPCRAVRTVQDMVERIGQEGVETADRLFPPMVTLWPCVHHIHRDAPACRAAVARLNATRVAQGLAPGAPLTGGDCQARPRRPETWLDRLVPLRGPRLPQQPPRAWHWHGRAGKSGDGSGGSRPDTAANPQASPQPGRQQPGRGCPVARRVGRWSWACGAGVAAAGGRSKGPQSREPRLCHGLQAHREREALVLAERCSCSSGEVAVVLGRGSASVLRVPQRRPVDLRGGRRVGREEHGVAWATPQRPAWRDEATSAGWPAPVALRGLRVCVPQRGCRTRVVLVATTVLEAQGDAKEDLAGRSRARGQAALARRSSTPTRQMDVLRGKTPAMVRQESWGQLLVYHRLRAALAQAARGHGVGPRQVRLPGTRQTRAALHSLLAQRPSTARERVVHIVLSASARHRVGTRPDRDEPRACKRRPKPSPLLRIPRQQARARLATAA
jgi:hypothetical protein